MPLFPHPVVTIGSFDGVHSGHRILLDQVIGQARAKHGTSIVITFSPHPRQVIEGVEEIKLLNSLGEKSLLLEQIGIDAMIVIPFTLTFSRMTASSFVEECLVGKVHVETLVVGYNHRFGHDRAGAAELCTMGQQLGFEVIEVDQNTVEGCKVSSTEIRKLIAAGNMSRAALLLTRPYFIMTDIYRHRALSDIDEKLLPREGRYNVLVNGTNDVATVRQGKVTLDKSDICGDATIEFV